MNVVAFPLTLASLALSSFARYLQSASFSPKSPINVSIGQVSRSGLGAISFTDGDVCQGTMTSASGNVYEGKWVNGEFLRGKIVVPNKFVYEGEGKINGHGICTYFNGDFYTGNRVNGLRNGQGTMLNKSCVDNPPPYAPNLPVRQVYDGMWKNGQFVG